MMETPIVRFTKKAIAAEMTNPQKPHIFHLKRATAHITLTIPRTARAGNAQSGIRGILCLIVPVPSRYRSAIAEFATIINTRYVVKQPCRSFRGPVVLSAITRYVSAMHWKELTTSSGPFSVKKLS